MILLERNTSQELTKISAALRRHQIKGFLSDEEGRCLFESVLAASANAPVLEIGSYCGRSTAFLAAAAKQKNTLVYALDHHRGSEEHQPGHGYCDLALVNEAGEFDTLPTFRQTLKALDIQQVVCPLLFESTLLAPHWDTPLSLIFIDGGHSFDQAFNDLNLWSKKLTESGRILMHDIYPEGSGEGQAPRQALERFLKEGMGQWQTRKLYGSIVEIYRP